MARGQRADGLASMNTAEGYQQHLEWERTLFDARWAVVVVARGEYGAAGRPSWVVIFEEEYTAAAPPPGHPERDLPARPDPVRARHPGPAGPLPARHGVRRQDLGPGLERAQRRQRPREPHQPGRQDGDHWVLNGQKTWSTRAVFCDYLFGLFRTDPRPSATGASPYFSRPLDAEGVTVRPIGGLHDDGPSPRSSSRTCGCTSATCSAA